MEKYIVYRCLPLEMVARSLEMVAGAWRWLQGAYGLPLPPPTGPSRVRA
ncbi:MAG: hypothetical protein ACP5PV_07720 [Methanothrix sp.]